MSAFRSAALARMSAFRSAALARMSAFRCAALARMRAFRSAALPPIRVKHPARQLQRPPRREQPAVEFSTLKDSSRLFLPASATFGGSLRLACALGHVCSDTHASVDALLQDLPRWIRAESVDR
jgi:hypothetical protein